jgi:holin-like protein
MVGFLILVGCQLAGAGIHRLGVPLPSGVLGLLLLFGGLAVGWIRLDWVERAAEFMVRHMLLLFIPLLAGLTQMKDELRRDGLALVASVVVSLMAVLLTTGALGERLLPKIEPTEAAEAEALE